jgi:hypothetical protein
MATATCRNRCTAVTLRTRIDGKRKRGWSFDLCVDVFASDVGPPAVANCVVKAKMSVAQHVDRTVIGFKDISLLTKLEVQIAVGVW